MRLAKRIIEGMGGRFWQGKDLVPRKFVQPALGALAENAAASLVLLDKKGRIIFWNKQTTELTGGREAKKGTYILDRKPLKEDSTKYNLIHKLLKTKEPFNRRMLSGNFEPPEGIPKGEYFVQTDFSGTPIYNRRKKHIGFALLQVPVKEAETGDVMHDLTNSIALLTGVETVKARIDDSKKRIAEIIELKKVLEDKTKAPEHGNALERITKLLEEEQDNNEKKKKSMNTLENAKKRLFNAVDAHYELRKPPKQINMVELLEEMKAEFPKKINVGIHYDADTKHLIKAHPVGFKNALTNALVNSVNAGAKNADVFLKKEHGNIEVRICNDGPPFEEGILEKGGKVKGITAGRKGRSGRGLWNIREFVKNSSGESFLVNAPHPKNKDQIVATHVWSFPAASINGSNAKK